MAAQRRCVPGFTLVELMVVVTIIVILIALLLPSMEQAIAMGQVARCASNLHNLGVATVGYANDFERIMPNCINFGLGRPNYDTDANWGHTWHADTSGETGIRPLDGDANHTGAVLWKYATNEGNFMCPVFPALFGKPDPAAHLAAHSAPEHLPGLSYSMHESMQSGGWMGLSLTVYGGPWYEGGGKTYPVQPADTLMYAEEDLWANKYSPYSRNNQKLGVQRSRSQGPVDAIGDFHPTGGKGGDPNEGTTNVGFLDGHVARYHPSDSRDLAFPGDLWLP
jgi:prepilin-type N-terminal cleavage/methylation domain-containing protein/prepilin-type processing-associated H-X9-DG protein